MAHVDGVLGSSLLAIYAVVRAVVEDDAVLQDLAYAAALVGVGCLQHFDSARSVGGHGACKEVSTCTEAQLGGPEGILHCTIGAALRDKAARRGRAVLPFGQAVDTVVEQNHVQVDVATVGMDEVVASDSQSVAVTAHLPYREVGVGHLATCGNGGCASVDGVHAVGGHVVGQTTATSDAADDGCLPRCHAYLGHCLVQAVQEEVVAAARTPPRLSFLEVLESIF